MIFLVGLNLAINPRVNKFDKNMRYFYFTKIGCGIVQEVVFFSNIICYISINGMFKMKKRTFRLSFQFYCYFWGLQFKNHNMLHAQFQDLSYIKKSNSISLYREELPYFVVPCHFHPFIEIMYITSGTGTRFVGDSIEPYESGDICMIGSNLIHEWRNDKQYFNDDSELKATCFCLFFNPELYYKEYLSVPEFEKIQTLIQLSQRGIKFHGETRNKIAALIEVGENKLGIGKVINLLEILDVMSESSEYELLTSIIFSNNFESAENARFNKIYEYLIRNYTQTISLKAVADQAALSPTAFCRYFKSRTNQTLKTYLNAIRIGHAKKLLITGKMKVSTIAIEVGFNNFSNFVEQFKRTTSMTPTEYQKQHMAKNTKIL